MAFYIYIIYSERYDKFYIGQTQDFTTRLKRHNSGIEKFTSPFLPWITRCVIEKTTRGEAMVLERKLKNLNREKLLKFIDKYSNGGWDAALPSRCRPLASAFESRFRSDGFLYLYVQIIFGLCTQVKASNSSPPKRDIDSEFKKLADS